MQTIQLDDDTHADVELCRQYSGEVQMPWISLRNRNREKRR